MRQPDNLPAFCRVHRNGRPLIRQMSMSKPVRPNMATVAPLGPPRAQTAQEQHAGLLELDAQPSAVSIRLPEGAAPKVPARCRCGELTSGYQRGIGPRTRNLEGSTLPGAMVSGAHAVLQSAGHVDLDPHSQTRPG